MGTRGHRAWLSLVLFSLGCAPAEPPAPAAPVALQEPAQSEAALADPRLQDLLRQCTRDGFYDRNLADPLAILVGKLQSGDSAPLQRAIEELGAAGERAMPDLERLYRELFTDAARMGTFQNVLGALSLNRSAGARRLLMETLGHPHSTPRLSALRGLLQQDLGAEEAGPLAYTAAIELGPARALALECLFMANPEAAAELSLDWLERGTAGEALPVALRQLVHQRAKLPSAPRERLAERLPGVQAVFLWASLLPEDGAEGALAGALAGSARSASEALLTALTGTEEGLAGEALEALVHAEQLEWLGRLAAELPSDGLRLRATTGLANALWPMDRSMEFLRLAPGPARERTIESLRARLDDASQPVREEAWSVLLRCGDAEAFDRALLALGESERSLQLLVQPLRDCLRSEAEAGGSALIERALARLEELLAERESEPLAGRRLRLLQTLALVPDARAAERLLALARTSSGTIEGLRAHEWLMIQASNSGSAGRTRLYAALFEEPDPIRRLDLIWVLGSVPDEASRQRLLELLDDERLSQAERLFAAQQLCQMGPTERIAPAIKRLAPRFDHQARRGLQCLLWRWY
jgi:hypothetical protein